LKRAPITGSLFVASLLPAACGLVSCATSLGPGYVVEKQEILVTFRPQPEPRVHVAAQYRLKNIGNQSLDDLDVRLPGRVFQPTANTITWDGIALAPASSADNPRDTLLHFPDSWPVGTTHTLRFEYVLSSSPAQQSSGGFSADAFILPAGTWSPVLPQSRGVFGFGGVPPSKWPLAIRVPREFLVHASGTRKKQSDAGAETEFQFQQTMDDLIPFAIAGRYQETRQELPQSQTIHLWSRGHLDPAAFRQAGDSLSRTLSTYDALFGARGKSNPPLWIVENPAGVGPISQAGAGYSSLLFGDDSESAAAMISRDTVVLQSRLWQGQPEAMAGPALAAGWLGYGQNPGFYEQQPPVSALPAFAAAQAREVSEGPQVREQIIRRALAQIPPDATRNSNDDPNITRAKSLLLFFALRDRIGGEAFQKAMQHILAARRSRSFDVTDLISAVEQETRQPVGPFVREWIKRPGVPENFRAKYSQATASTNSSAQEATQ
jgi:hypothetical protein